MVREKNRKRPIYNAFIRIVDSRIVLFLVCGSMSVYLTLSMLFWSQNSLRVHLKVNREIDALEKSQEYYHLKVYEHNEMITKFRDSAFLREWLLNHYLMTKPGEYIIFSGKEAKE